MFVASTALTGCGPSEARSATNPMRPIEEWRAMQIIAEALSEEGLQATQPKKSFKTGDVAVVVDVGVHNRKIGFVYLTASDVDELGDHPLAAHHDESKLTVKQGQEQDAEMHVVVLYASDYVFDDHAGSDRNAPAITAENKLARDVRDFVIIARKNHWQ